MESPDDRVQTQRADDDQTSSVRLDAAFDSTATPDGQSDSATKGDDLEHLIERMAQLKASEPVPKLMNEAHEVAEQVAAKVAASPRGAVSPDVRRAFAELLTANSEFLHRNARRSA